RGEVHANFLGFENIDESAEDRGFSRARPAGEYGDFGYEGVFEAGALLFGEFEAGFFLGPLDGGVGSGGGGFAANGGQAGDDGGDLLFGAVEHGQLDERRAGQRVGLAGGLVAREGAGLDEGVDAGFEVAAFGLQELGGVADEVGFADGGVAFFLEDFEGVDEAGVEAGRGVVGEAEVDEIGRAHV